MADYYKEQALGALHETSPFKGLVHETLHLLHDVHQEIPRLRAAKRLAGTAGFMWGEYTGIALSHILRFRQNNSHLNRRDLLAAALGGVIYGWAGSVVGNLPEMTVYAIDERLSQHPRISAYKNKIFEFKPIE